MSDPLFADPAWLSTSGKLISIDITHIVTATLDAPVADAVNSL